MFRARIQSPVGAPSAAETSSTAPSGQVAQRIDEGCFDPLMMVLRSTLVVLMSQFNSAAVIDTVSRRSYDRVVPIIPTI
jgi:hypothetical protein